MGAFDDLIPTPTQTENPFSDLIPEAQAQGPSLDREVEREDLRRQMREARAEGIGDKAILGLAELGERAAYTASLMDPLTAIGRVINPYQQTPLPAETVRKAIDFFDPLSRSDVVAGSAMEGAKQFGSELVSGLAQPEAAAAMLTGKINPQLPGRLFQPGLIKASPMAAAALAEAETPAEATKAALELGLTVGGTAGIEAHGARAGRAKPTDLRGAEIAEPIPKPEVVEAKPPVPEPTPKPAEPAPVPETSKPKPVEAKIGEPLIVAAKRLPSGEIVYAREHRAFEQEGVEGESGFLVVPESVDPMMFERDLVALDPTEQSKLGVKFVTIPEAQSAKGDIALAAKQSVDKPSLTPEQEALQPSAPPPEPAKVAEVKPESVTEGEAPLPEMLSQVERERAFVESLAKKYGSPVSPTVPATEPYETISRFRDMLERAADESRDELELDRILSAAKGMPDESRIAWAIANNPYSTAETFSRAKANDALRRMTSDENIATLDARREELRKQRGLSEPQPTPPPAVSPTEVKGKQAWEMTKAEWTRHEQRGTAYEFTDEKVTEARNEEAKARRVVDDLNAKRKALGNTESIRKVMTDRKGALERNQARRDADKEIELAKKEWHKWASRSVGRATHEGYIKRALESGKPVPAEVLADYPDLAPKQPPPQPSAGIEKPKGAEKPSPILDHWRSKVEPVLHDFFAAFNDFGADRLERNGIKPVGMSASDWLLQIKSRQPTWHKGGRKTGSTGIQMLSQKGLWPTEGPEGEALRRAMLNAVKSLKDAPGMREDWIRVQEQSSTQRTGTPTSPPPAAPTVGETKATGIQGMGGATPAEFAKGQGSPTAMKYRLIDQERQKRGLEPLSKPDRISDQAVMDKAIGEMDRNPNLPDQLIKELNEKPRSIEDWENHVLLLRKIELREEYHKSAREAMQAYADSAQFPERLADMQAANARTQFYSERLTELEQASRVAGSARGRALRALRVMANEDFSLASLEMEKRAANNWRPLTPDERGELIKIADEHKAKSEELQKRLDELEKAQQDKEVGQVLTDLKGEVAKTPKAAVTPVEVSAAKIRNRLSKNPKADIRFFVRKIARYFVSQGTKERNTLIDQVHGVLSEIIPDLDKRTTSDLISGYGDYSRLPKDTVSVILRDLSGQMQQISKLEDMMSGKAPLRSGQERRTPTDVERILQKQVEEQKKKGGYTVTDPETQLRTAQQAVQKRLENQIKDLELQIQTRQKIIKNPTKLQYDKKNLELQARRNELKSVYDEIFAKPPKTEAERLAAWKERTRDRIDELKEFLAGTKQPKQRPTPVVLDKEALRIRFDLHTIERVWREKLYKDKLSKQAGIDKVIRGGKELLNVPRAMMASYDLSAPGRQGIIIGLAHPIRAARALKPMFEAWHSEKGAFKAAEELRNRDNAPLYETSKLYLAEHGGRLSAQEEVYMSRWAQKIPGVRKSERAYVTFLNRLRADSFDAMVKGLTADGRGNPAELKAIANFINVATGRGTGLERYAETLNTTFFAPRYVASRFQFLLGQPLYRGSGRTRALIAKEYGRFLAGAAVVYGLAMAADADVEHDWRSSDFGKIRFGDTRIDPMAGLVQNSTLIGRTLTGETKTTKGKVHPLWPASKVPFNRDNWFDVITRFGRSKLAPIPGNVVNLVLGQNVIGQPVTPADVAIQSVTPISWRDVYQNMVDNGVPAGMAMGILSIFGVGVNTYEQQHKR